MPPFVNARSAMSNTGDESARIKQPVRVEFLFQRAHQAFGRADFAPDVELTFDLVGGAQNDHLSTARLRPAPQLGELSRALPGSELVEPEGVPVQSDDAVGRVR